MRDETKILLEGLAFSNFYFSNGLGVLMLDLVVGEQGNIVHIGPKSGRLGWCCAAASADAVGYIRNLETPDVVEVGTGREYAERVLGVTRQSKENERTYYIHASRDSIPSGVNLLEFLADDYRALAGKR